MARFYWRPTRLRPLKTLLTIPSRKLAFGVIVVPLLVGCAVQPGPIGLRQGSNPTAGLAQPSCGPERRLAVSGYGHYPVQVGGTSTWAWAVKNCRDRVTNLGIGYEETFVANLPVIQVPPRCHRGPPTSGHEWIECGALESGETVTLVLYFSDAVAGTFSATVTLEDRGKDPPEVLSTAGYTVSVTA